MALSTIPITAGVGTAVAVDTSGGGNMQIVKMAESVLGSTSLIPSSVAQGLTVDVTRVQGVVVVNNPTAANLKVDASGVNVPIVNGAATTIAISAGAATPIAVRLSTGAAFIDTFPVSIAATVTVAGTVSIGNTPAVSQSGVWNIATVTTITNTVTVAGTVAISGTVPVSGTITAAQGAPAVIGNAWVTKITDGVNPCGVTNVAGVFALKVDVIKQVGGGVSQQDRTAFTDGTTFAEPMAGYYKDAATAPGDGQAAALRCSLNRALHVNIRKNDGTELGIVATPIRTDPTGTTTQPVNGTVTVNQGATPWVGNLTQLLGVAVVAAAAGIQKVGISDDAGTSYSQAHALAVQNGPSVSTGQTPWRNGIAVAAGAVAQVLHTPGGGKTSYVEGFSISVSTTGVVKIFDNTDAATNYLFFGRVGNSADGAADFNQALVICPARPMPLNALNNVLRYTTGSAIGWITVWGYDA